MLRNETKIAVRPSGSVETERMSVVKLVEDVRFLMDATRSFCAEHFFSILGACLVGFVISRTPVGLFYSDVGLVCLPIALGLIGIGVLIGGCVSAGLHPRFQMKFGSPLLYICGLVCFALICNVDQTVRPVAERIAQRDYVLVQNEWINVMSANEKQEFNRLKEKGKTTWLNCIAVAGFYLRGRKLQSSEQMDMQDRFSKGTLPSEEQHTIQGIIDETSKSDKEAAMRSD